jgi:Stromalin conservative domain
VFSHRYRDVVPEVRAACVHSLGEWIHAYPSVFLADSYLKYIGWLLNDKVSLVRHSSLAALIHIFATPDFVGQLAHFAERFRARFIECTLDIDPAVAVLAIELCVLLSR